MALSSRSRQRIPRPVGWAALFGAVVAVSCGALLAFVLLPQASTNMAPSAAPSDFAVSSAEFRDPQTVPLSVSLSAPVELSTTATGRVTAMACVKDSPIQSGDVLMEIDARPVIALATSVPIYRDLTWGVRGPDVDALAAGLRQLGYDAPATTKYDGDLIDVIVAFQKDRGISPADGILRTDSVIWIPRESTAPSECLVRLGQTYTGRSPFANIPGLLQSLHIVQSVDRPLVSGARTLSILGVTVTAAEDGSISDPTEVAAIAGSPRFPDALAKIDSSPITGQSTLVESLAVASLPPAALFSIEGTRACVQLDNGPSPVEIVGAGMGATLVTFAQGVSPTRVLLGKAITSTSCSP